MRPCPTYWTERSFLPPKHWRAASCMQSCPMNCSSTRPGDGYWIAEPLLRLGIEKASRFREASPVAPQDIPPSAIGRASGRESVGQYVEIPEGSVYIKKKQYIK